MPTFADFKTQAREMHNQLIIASTEAADRWLESTLAMLDKLPASAPASGYIAIEGPKPSPMPAKPPNGGSLTTVTRRVLEGLGKKTFSTVELRELIEIEVGPMQTPTKKANLSNLLRRMADRGELKLVKKAKGPRPSIFKRVLEEPKTQTEEQYQHD